MERSSFGTRARQRIWHGTRASIKGRFTPLLVTVIGVAVGYFYSLFFLHKQTTKEVVIVALVSGVGANLIWFLASFVVNTVRVPWLLDAESTGLINTQETRAENAEQKLAQNKQARDRHDLFGRLMQEGLDFSWQIAKCQTDAHFASWERHFNDWLRSVQQEMKDMGFPTDAVEFARAGKYAEPVMGVINTGSKQEARGRILEKHQEYLADFVQRRLP